MSFSVMWNFCGIQTFCTVNILSYYCNVNESLINYVMLLFMIGCCCIDLISSGIDVCNYRSNTPKMTWFYIVDNTGFCLSYE